MTFSLRATWRAIQSAATRGPAESPALAMALCALLCLNGIWWGQNELWNADPVAFKDHFREDALPFSPEKFDKPPLLSYVSFFTAIVPGELVARSADLVLGSENAGWLEYTSTWLLKFWHLFYACLTVYLLWRIVANAAGTRAAGISAMLLASAAGFVVQAHLITTDLPLVLIMLLAFFTCQRLWEHNRLRDYAIAGLCIGLTGALKYNGLVVGLALPMFHFLRNVENGVLKAVFDRRFIIGLICVPLGFLFGNPFAAIEFNRFVGDVTYLFVAAPDYVGANNLLGEQTNILVTMATDHIGWPLFVLICVALPIAIFRACKEPASCRAATIFSAAAIGAIYGLYFHLQTNVQVRWLLPLVPLALIAVSPVWELVSNRWRMTSNSILSVVVIYGIICCVSVGLRFVGDPRFEALNWVEEQVPTGATIESSSYVPRWNYHAGIDVDYVRMPNVSGRRRIYENLLANNPRMLEEMRSRERDSVEWYSIEELRSRSPDFVAVSSIYFERFFEPEVSGYYPEMTEYFTALLGGTTGFDVVFDKACCNSIDFLYPKQILFVDNRIVILQRSNTNAGLSHVD